MNIKKITLKERGFKGMKIIFNELENKDGSTWSTAASKDPQYPIPLSMEKQFKQLREHLLNICEVCQNPHDDDEFTYAVNDTEVKSVERDLTGFCLIGKKKIGDKEIPLKTYWVEEGDYHKFNEVMDLIKEIVSEAKEYLAGNRQISTEELGQRLIENLISKGKKADLDEFNAMSEDEKSAFCKKYLEDTGAIVIEADEIDVPDDNVVELKQA